MDKEFWIFMMIVTCMNSIHSMQKDKEKKIIQSNRNHILNDSELALAMEKFGDVGTEVAQALLLGDKEKIIKQKRSLQSFKVCIKGYDYHYFSVLAQRYVDVDIKMLKFIFSDVVYEEYVSNIKEACKSIVTSCKEKKYCVEEAKKLFDQTEHELSICTKNREISKQVMLESYVFNRIIDEQKTIIFDLWNMDFEVNKHNLRKMIDIQFACIQNIESDVHKKQAQEFFSHFCYQLSISAWSKNNTKYALEYGIAAYKTAIEWDIGSQTTRTSLNNWLEQLGGAKYEEAAIKVKPTIGKRKFPLSHAIEKRQKMFIH